MKRALNQMTTPHLGFEQFLALAAELGCIGVEARNDMAALGRPLFDGMPPEVAGDLVRANGLRLVGLSQVYPFNNWNADRAQEVRDLISTANAAGAETISLIPRNDGSEIGNGERQANLRIALKEAYPLLAKAEMTALVEPLGFGRSSLRRKSELIDTIETLGFADRIKIVHDTFHHMLAGDGDFYAEHTGILHISGITDQSLAIDRMEDEDRGLVDENDRLGNVEQIAALLGSGYDGPVSFECFSPVTQQLQDPMTAIGRSFEFIETRIERMTA